MPIIGPAPDTRPWDHCRVEIAFATGPDDPNPAFVDLTAKTQLSSGITTNRGRATNTDTVQPGRCSFTLDNLAGEFTPGNTSSPYYPNVLPMRRGRLTYRDPATYGSGNLLSSNQATLETSIADWAASGSVPPTLSQSAVRSHSGTKSLLITWGTGGTFPAANTTVVGMVAGRTYTASAWVYVPTGSPAVNLAINGVVGTASAVTNAWTQVSVTFTPTASVVVAASQFQVWPATSATSGQQAWVDELQIDEGSTVGTFSTTPPPIFYRFDGFVDEWPTSWPTGSDVFAQSRVSMGDLLTRIGGRQKLKSVVSETILADGPTEYWPLFEPAGATSLGSIVPGTPAPLIVQSVGAGGGSVTFASGTGPPTDGASAPMFAPASSTSGYRLIGGTELLGSIFYGDVAVEAAFATSTVVAATIVRLNDDFNASYVDVGVDGTGHLFVTFYDGWTGGGVLGTVTSSTIVTDGHTHHVAARVTYSGGNLTLQLILDGASAGTTTFAVLYGAAPALRTVSIGGNAGGGCFTGTISHVATYRYTVPLLAAFAMHSTAQTTGFAGERSDQRIARIAKWAGLTTAQLLLDVGLSTSIGHIDCTGMQPLDYMRQVEATEQGLLYADTSGHLVFRNRAFLFMPSLPSVTLPDTQMIDPSTAVITTNLQQLANDVTVTRANGPSVNVTDLPSIATYGDAAVQVTSLATSDSELADLANWRLNMGKTPRTRADNLALDAFTDGVLASILRSLDLLSFLRINTMPAQASASTLDLDVQGISDAISADGWYITVNTTAHTPLTALILDDPVNGLLDGPPVLAF